MLYSMNRGAKLGSVRFEFGCSMRDFDVLGIGDCGLRVQVSLRSFTS